MRRACRAVRLWRRPTERRVGSKGHGEEPSGCEMGLLFRRIRPKDAWICLDKSKRDDFAAAGRGNWRPGTFRTGGRIYDRIRGRMRLSGCEATASRWRIITSFHALRRFTVSRIHCFWRARRRRFTCAGANGCDCGLTMRWLGLKGWRLRFVCFQPV